MDQISYKINDWVIRPDVNQLVKGKQEHVIGSRTMQVLLVLAKRNGEIVTRTTLLTSVWRNVFVDEGSLTKCISQLRSIFKDEGDPEIETLKSIGYRFKATIESSPDQIYFPTSRKGFLTATVSALLVILLGLTSLPLYFSGIEESYLTTSETVERAPRFSPDGQHIIYAQTKVGMNNLEIHSKDLKTGLVHEITNNTHLDTDPIWSPRTAQVAYTRYDSKAQVIIMGYESRDEQVIASTSHFTNLTAMDWHPSKDIIAYGTYQGFSCPSAIHLHNIKTQKESKILHPALAQANHINPRFSPDGNKLSVIIGEVPVDPYRSTIPYFGDVYVYDMSNLSWSQITNNNTAKGGADWSFDGKELFVIELKDIFNFEVVKYEPEKGNRVVVYNSKKLIRNIDYHPEKEAFLFEEWSEPYKIWKFGKTYAPLINSGEKSYMPDISPDGNLVVYISNISGSSELWLHDLRTGDHSQLTFEANKLLSWPKWSPDGKRIVFEYSNTSKKDIWLYELESKSSKPLLEKEETSSPSWSKDGHSIYYTLHLKAGSQIKKLDLSSLKSSTIIENGEISIAYNGDIYFTKPNLDGIWKIEQGNVELVTDELKAGDHHGWTISNDKIFMIKRREFNKAEVSIIDLETLEDIRSVQMPRFATNYFSGLAVFPKTQEFLVTLAEWENADIKLITGF